MNNFNDSKPTRLSKVYFTWVIRDFGSAEWFHSLLHAIEEQDTQNRIEINIYLTARIKEDDMNNIFVRDPSNLQSLNSSHPCGQVQDVGAEKDAITSLRAPTHFGRPNWDRVFSSLTEKHSDSDVGVFFCGPTAISKALHTKCNEYSTPRGTRFFFGKGEFHFFPIFISVPSFFGSGPYRSIDTRETLSSTWDRLWGALSMRPEGRCADADFCYLCRKLLNIDDPRSLRLSKWFPPLRSNPSLFALVLYSMRPPCFV